MVEMSYVWKQWLIFQSFVYFGWCSVNYLCQESCRCNLTKEHQTLTLICSNRPQAGREDGFVVDRPTGAHHCNDTFPLHSNFFAASNVVVECFDILFQDFNFKNFTNLSHLSIIHSNLRGDSLPSDLHQINKRLSFLNISNNNVTELQFLSDYHQHARIQTLDLSRNRISVLEFSPKTLPKLRYLFVQRNNVVDFSSVKNLVSLEVLDASYNSLSFENSKLNEVSQLKKLILHSIPAVTQFNFQTCDFDSKCAVLPPNLEVLDLSNNQLLNIPHCSDILKGLQKLQVLLLENNKISFVSKSSFYGDCFDGLKVLSLHNNTLVKLDPDFLGAVNLRTLILSNNYLQHISLSALQHFLESYAEPLGQSVFVSHYQQGITLLSNQWSCDCFQQELYNWIISQNASVSIECHIPEKFRGLLVQSLNETDLVCLNASISLTDNATKVAEYADGTLSCQSEGIPKPTVYWYTPQGKVLTCESLVDNGESYSLSPFGENLTIKDVRLSKTGIFRCVANNSFSSANSTVALSVVLSSLSTIIYLVIACIAFIIAIILNSVNMCMYTYEHVQAKRRYKKAIQEQEKEERLNPSIRQRSRAPVDDSMASLNADRHYGRYDFTCQQMFLDTVIKGAHSVKKTLYDARHSEFSANMWGYAASIKDRLHIELPSQLPSISMPSISMPSMPTISMPSMPTMQDINTNIEKLSSSMMTRSHNLATSVGSVFTLKRWIWQQQDNNSSSDDNESKESSEENLEKMDFKTSVNVDVHRDDVDDCPSTSKHEDRREGIRLAFSRLMSNRSDTEVNAPSTSKSLPDYTRRRVAGNSAGKTPSKTVTFVSEDITIEPTSSKIEPKQQNIFDSPAIVTISEEIDKSFHSYETSV